MTPSLPTAPHANASLASLRERRCDGRLRPEYGVLLSLTHRPEAEFAREATLSGRCCVHEPERDRHREVLTPGLYSLHGKHMPRLLQTHQTRRTKVLLDPVQRRLAEEARLQRPMRSMRETQRRQPGVLRRGMPTRQRREVHPLLRMRRASPQGQGPEVLHQRVPHQPSGHRGQEAPTDYRRSVLGKGAEVGWMLDLDGKAT